MDNSYLEMYKTFQAANEGELTNQEFFRRHNLAPLLGKLGAVLLLYNFMHDTFAEQPYDDLFAPLTLYGWGKLSGYYN